SDVFFSNNGGVSFTAATFPGGAFSQGRQSLATGPVVGPPKGPTNPPGGVVYAMMGAADGIEYAKLAVSFNAGVTWNPGTVLPPTIPSFNQAGVTIDGTADSNFSQSFYDQALLVNPSDASNVYFGGVGLYVSTTGHFGSTWNFLATTGGVHSDVH